MTTPAPQPGQLHDEIFVYPAGVSLAVAALEASCPAHMTMQLTQSALAAVCGFAPLTDAPGFPSPEVTRRIRYYTAQWFTGQLDGIQMHEIACRWPAWNRTHTGPVAAECGWTDYVDAAAIRRITRGEAA
jgi:hypothetical protein